MFLYNSLIMKRPFAFALISLLTFVVLIVLIRPRWYSNLTRRVDVSPESGARLVEQYNCRQCHIIGGWGAIKGPGLDQVSLTRDESQIWQWLENPRRVKRDTAMPNFHLSDSEIAAIVAYLKSLNAGGRNEPTSEGLPAVP